MSIIGVVDISKSMTFYCTFVFCSIFILSAIKLPRALFLQNCFIYIQASLTDCCLICFTPAVRTKSYDRNPNMKQSKVLQME